MSAVLCLNPYKSRAMLWREKNGKRDPSEFSSFAMERGIAYEDEALEWARAAFFPEFEAKTIGMVYGPNMQTACSPDLVLLAREKQIISGIEAKVPLPHNIPDSVGTIPAQHVTQVAMCIHVLAAHEWNLFYYDPDQKEHNKMFNFRTISHEKLEEFFLEKAKEFLEKEDEPKRSNPQEREKNLKWLLSLLLIKQVL